MSWTALLAANRAAQTRTTRPDPWRGSPFAWLKALPQVQRGREGAELLRTLMTGFGYQRVPGALAQSFVVNGFTVKVKMSMAWSGADVFKFQQIERGNYTHLAMLGLEPQSASLWICEKDLAFNQAEHQHKAESRWIQFGVGHPPDWLKPYGGHIDLAAATCRAQLGPP